MAVIDDVNAGSDVTTETGGRPIDLDDLYSISSPADPSISPDGLTAVYTLRHADRQSDSTVSRLWSAATDGSTPARRLTSGPADHSPRYSPDGSRIAFTRVIDGRPQVFLLPADGGEARQVTFADQVPGGAGVPVFSPDGRRIAFTAPVDRMARAAKAPTVIDTMNYKLDGQGIIAATRHHVHVTDLDTGFTRQITDGDWQASAPAWSPDGTRLAFVSAFLPAAALRHHSWVRLIDVEDPLAAPRDLGRARCVGGPLAFTPDGNTVLAVGKLEPGASIARLIEQDVESDETRVLGADLDRNIMPGSAAYPGGAPSYTADGAAILFCLRDGGRTRLFSLDRATGSAAPLDVSVDGVAVPGQVVAGLSVAHAAGKAVVCLNSYAGFGELYSLDLATGTSRRLSDFLGTSLPGVDLLVTEPRSFEISDGTTVHGWVLRHPDTSGAGPLLLDIHGGPHNAWTGTPDAGKLYHQLLAENGWTILTLNPRGSDGYGDDFYAAVVDAWGISDANDFLEPVDRLIAEGLVDPARLAVTGYSYGGFATCYLTATTDRFAAAVGGGVVCDLPSQLGSSDHGRAMAEIEMAGAPRDRLWELSPMSKIDNVRTPTLLLHGAADVRCPVEQAEHWFQGLQSRGVPSRLVTYPDSSHLFMVGGRPSYRIDYNRRVIDWVQRYVDGAGPRGEDAAPAPMDAGYWQRTLDAAAATFEVPGAQFGILELDRRGGELSRTVVSTGVLNRTTGAPVQGDSVFQIGSITKVWTTALIMQLVEEGRLDLDAPVRDVLPGLELAEEEVAAAVTTRDLLCHRSGIDGDVFTSTGDNGDAVEKYVELMASIGQVHPLGKGFSYCNAGFVLAGRIVEVLRGKAWNEVVRERLIVPLGLDRALSLDGEALLVSSAVGHVYDEDDEQARASKWSLARSVGPAGTLAASAGELLDFAAMFLREGEGPGGSAVLSPESTRAMLVPQLDLRDLTANTSAWGLGWQLEDWDGVTAYGHDGATIGQNSYLRVFPEQGVALVLLSNGGLTAGLSRTMFTDAAAVVMGVRPPEWLAPSTSATGATADADVASYVGTYVSAGTDVEVSAEGGVLTATVVTKLHSNDPDGPDPRETLTLHPVSGGLFAVRRRLGAIWTQMRFVTDADGRDYLYNGTRCLPKA